MRTESCRFFSNGLRLEGTFYFPARLRRHKYPLVVVCSGFTGMNDFHPARFARYLTRHSMLCFGFDYRGFGNSQGTAGTVILDEQIRDIEHAVTFARTHPRVDGTRIVLAGWGMGAGLVLAAAGNLRLRALVAMNGFYSGKRFEEFHRGKRGLATFMRRAERDRLLRASTGAGLLHDAYEIYPLDPDSRKYVNRELVQVAGFNARATFDLGDSIMRFLPEVYAGTLRVPILIAHGAHNRLHAPEEAKSLYATYAGPKELYWIAGGHTEWMFDEHPAFLSLAGKLVRWLRGVLR